VYQNGTVTRPLYQIFARRLDAQAHGNVIRLQKTLFCKRRQHHQIVALNFFADSIADFVFIAAFIAAFIATRFIKGSDVGPLRERWMPVQSPDEVAVLLVGFELGLGRAVRSQRAKSLPKASVATFCEVNLL
jgi:hypothetical protein